MSIVLTVRVPYSLEEDYALTTLVMAKDTEEGITINTSDGKAIDVDLIDVERGA